MKKIIAYAILTVLLSISSLFALGQSDNSEVQPASGGFEALTITDSRGRVITIDHPIEQIAFSHYSIGEGLRIVDGWEMVAARDGYTSDKIIFPNLEELPQIAQNPYDINYEILFDIDVDLLITADLPMAGFDEMVAKLDPEIPVVALNLQDSETLKENITKLGVLLGKEEEAQEYLEWYNNVIHEIGMRTKDLKEEEKTHYFQKTSWSGSIMTFTDEYPGIISRNDLTGSINVAANIPSQGGWVSSVDSEWIASQDIDVIINFDIVPNGHGTEIDDDTVLREYWEQIINNPVYSNSDAIKNNRFYMIANECWGTTRSIIGYCYMAKWFHPELFVDFDPQEIHQEYLTRFMRIDYDLDKHGVFVFPGE